jgi:hypothetical protein
MMNQRSVLRGLVLLTLLIVVGACLGLVGPQARPAMGLVQEADGMAPADFSAGSVVRAGRSPSPDAAGAVARRVKPGAAGLPGACSTGA